MKKFSIHIPANSDEELKAALAEVAYILTGLFESVKRYDDTWTGPAATNKRFWKEKASEWVDKHKVVIDVDQ